MKDDNKNKVIFNSTEGKSHLLDYFIDKIMPINTTISDIEFDIDIDKDSKIG
jgi:hypothetical protein